MEGAQFYARWVALGYAGQMHYLERNQDKRADPRLMVPGAQSVVCLGMDYFPETAADSVPAAATTLQKKHAHLTGQIAAYARGDDYHDLIKKRLFVLWDAIQEWTDGRAQGRVYVDTAPVLERELAQRAGLGWWGKNTCLIAKDRGSYFFLAEIILDQKLDHDQPPSTTAVPALAV